MIEYEASRPWLFWEKRGEGGGAGGTMVSCMRTKGQESDRAVVSCYTVAAQRVFNGTQHTVHLVQLQMV